LLEGGGTSSPPEEHVANPSTSNASSAHCRFARRAPSSAPGGERLGLAAAGVALRIERIHSEKQAHRTERFLQNQRKIVDGP